MLHDQKILATSTSPAMCQHDPSKWDRKAVRCWLLRHSRQQRLWVPQVPGCRRCEEWHLITCESGISACHQSSIVALGGESFVGWKYYSGLHLTVLDGFHPPSPLSWSSWSPTNPSIRPNPVNPHKRNKWNSKKPRDCPCHYPAIRAVETHHSSVK